MSEARDVALTVVKEVGAHWGLTIVYTDNYRAVHLLETRCDVRWPSRPLPLSAEASRLVVEAYVAEWLLLNGVPAITLAALYGGTPFPRSWTMELSWQEWQWHHTTVRM